TSRGSVRATKRLVGRRHTHICGPRRQFLFRKLCWVRVLRPIPRWPNKFSSFGRAENQWRSRTRRNAKKSPFRVLFPVPLGGLVLCFATAKMSDRQSTWGTHRIASRRDASD